MVNEFLKQLKRRRKNAPARRRAFKETFCKKYGWFCEANNTYEEGR